LNRLACHSKAMVVSAGKKLPKLNWNHEKRR
jgi:hypothetical protein